MREYRKDKIRRHQIVLSDKVLNGYKFYSMYNFTGEVLSQVRASKSTAGLQGLKMNSNILFIDLDSHEEADRAKVREALKDYYYEEYFSGSKGYHWHVRHQDVTSEHLVHSHKEFIKDLGIEDIVDTSIYRESGIIRIPDSIHETTGKKKEFLFCNEGKEDLELPIKKSPPWLTEHTEEGTEEAKLRYKRNLLRKVDVGGRHRHFYILYCSGRAAGRSPSEIMEDIQWYNDRLSDPKDESQLKREIKGFFK